MEFLRLLARGYCYKLTEFRTTELPLLRTCGSHFCLGFVSWSQQGLAVWSNWSGVRLICRGSKSSRWQGGKGRAEKPDELFPSKGTTDSSLTPWGQTDVEMTLELFDIITLFFFSDTQKLIDPQRSLEGPSIFRFMLGGMHLYGKECRPFVRKKYQEVYSQGGSNWSIYNPPFGLRGAAM
ncbi:hypothetical protein TNCV_4691291 [Trichonephila clavipes]|nr:hypothetical protein TNCV_4691291 [Trichonephila clavipes]